VCSTGATGNVVSDSDEANESKESEHDRED